MDDLKFESLNKIGKFIFKSEEDLNLFTEKTKDLLDELGAKNITGTTYDLISSDLTIYKLNQRLNSSFLNSIALEALALLSLREDRDTSVVMVTKTDKGSSNTNVELDIGKLNEMNENNDTIITKMPRHTINMSVFLRELDRNYPPNYLRRYSHIIGDALINAEDTTLVQHRTVSPGINLTSIDLFGFNKVTIPFYKDLFEGLDDMLSNRYTVSEAIFNHNETTFANRDHLSVCDYIIRIEASNVTGINGQPEITDTLILSFDNNFSRANFYFDENIYNWINTIDEISSFLTKNSKKIIAKHTFSN